MLRIEPSTFVSKIDILTTTPIVHNTSNHIDNKPMSIKIIFTRHQAHNKQISHKHYPMKPGYPTQPTQPIYPTQPTKPRYPTQPTKPRYPTQPTKAMTNYTHAPTVINSSVFHVQLQRFGGSSSGTYGNSLTITTFIRHQNHVHQALPHWTVFSHTSSHSKIINTTLPHQAALSHTSSHSDIINTATPGIILPLIFTQQYHQHNTAALPHWTVSPTHPYTVILSTQHSHIATPDSISHRYSHSDIINTTLLHCHTGQFLPLILTQ